MADWQLIETAPKDGTRVLVFVPGELMTGAYPNYDRGVLSARFEPEIGQWVVGGELWHDEALHLSDRHQPTHWMPTPRPPSLCMTPLKYVSFDLEMEGEPGAYWHIFSIDGDEKDSLRGDATLLTIDGPNTPEMLAAINAICEDIDKAVDIAERAKS